MYHFRLDANMADSIIDSIIESAMMQDVLYIIILCYKMPSGVTRDMCMGGETQGRAQHIYEGGGTNKLRKYGTRRGGGGG